MDYLSVAGFKSLRADFHRNEQKPMTAWKEGNQSKSDDILWKFDQLK